MAHSPALATELPAVKIALDAGSIAAAGAKDGSSNHPPANALSPSDTEQEAIDRCTGAYHELNKAATQVLHSLLADFNLNERLPTKLDFEATLHKSDSE